MAISKLNMAFFTVAALLLWAGSLPARVIEQTLSVTALGQPLAVRIMLPPDYSPNSAERFPTLYLNDGQDADAVGLTETLERLYREQRIAPVIVVAVPMLPDRMGIYGYSDRGAGVSLPAATRFGPVGADAHAYSEWLALHLVPDIDQRFRTIREPEARTILGWSLGAANAFNIAWNYPEVFGRVGGFSPSFWLSATAGDPSTAVVQALIAQKTLPEGFSLWLAVGDAEEDGDRDGDGVIDVIDDAQGVVEVLSAQSMPPGKPAVKTDLHLIQLPGGQHNQKTWGRMLPEFLIWAYPVNDR